METRAVEFDPFSRDFFDDPYETYADLREHAPCYHSEQYDFYALSRFDDVVAAHPRQRHVYLHPRPDLRAADHGKAEGARADHLHGSPRAHPLSQAGFPLVHPPLHKRLRGPGARHH